MPRLVAVIFGIVVVGLAAAGVWFLMSSKEDAETLKLTSTTGTTSTQQPTTVPGREPTQAPTKQDTAPTLKLTVSTPPGYTVRQLATVEDTQRFLLESDEPKAPAVSVRLSPTDVKNLAALRVPFAQAAKRSWEIAAPAVADSKLSVAGSPGHMYMLRFSAYDQMRIIAVSYRAKHELVVESAGAAKERKAGRDVVARVAKSHITITKE